VLVWSVLDAKPSNLFVVSAYAPTDRSDIGVKDVFYSDLAALLRSTRGSDIVVLAGDMNAQDFVQVSLSRCNIDFRCWEDLALNRTAWRNTVRAGVRKFNEQLLRGRERKRAVRKGAIGAIGRGDVTIWRCDVCGRECAGRLGLVGHQRTHSTPSAKRRRVRWAKAIRDAGTVAYGTGVHGMIKHWVSKKSLELLEARRNIPPGSSYNKCRRDVRRKLKRGLNADHEAWSLRKVREMETAFASGNTGKLYFSTIKSRSNAEVCRLNEIMEDCLRHSPDAGVDLLPGERLTDLDYADDKVLLFDNFQSAQVMLDAISRSAKYFGMRFAASKCKVLLQDCCDHVDLMLDNVVMEVVDRFVYLGSCISSGGGVGNEIEARISKARAVFANLRHLWRQRCISLKLKGRVYKTTVRAVLLYGSETWPLRVEDVNRLQVFDHRCLRSIARIGWHQRPWSREAIQNECYLERRKIYRPQLTKFHAQTVSHKFLPEFRIISVVVSL
ncbi:uncharacterized protein DEA37_0003388, partial [Paragonimus westermani]